MTKPNQTSGNSPQAVPRESRGLPQGSGLTAGIPITADTLNTPEPYRTSTFSLILFSAIFVAGCLFLADAFGPWPQLLKRSGIGLFIVAAVATAAMSWGLLALLRRREKRIAQRRAASNMPQKTMISSSFILLLGVILFGIIPTWLVLHQWGDLDSRYRYSLIGVIPVSLACARALWQRLINRRDR